MDDLIERAGGIGAFHVLFYVAIGSGTNCIRAFVNYLIPFQIQKQEYLCNYTDGTVGSQDGICTLENICDGLPEIASWAVDFTHERSLHNWVQQLDLMCEPDWKGGFLGTAFYFFWCLSLLVVARLADRVGRRSPYLTSRVIECGLFVATLLARDYWVMVGLMGAFGLAAAGRINVGTVYLTEWLPRKNQTAVHVIHQSGHSIVYISYTIFFWQVGN